MSTPTWHGPSTLCVHVKVGASYGRPRELPGDPPPRRRVRPLRRESFAGGGEVIVEHDQPVTLEGGGTTRVVLDLNSHVWLGEGSVESGAVARSTFESAAAVRVQ